MARKVHGLTFAALLLFLVILSSSSSSATRVFPQESDDQGDEVSTMTESNDDKIEQAMNGFSNVRPPQGLIGMEMSDGEEDCVESDEECLKRKKIAEANLDYIYTQNFNP